MLFRQRKDQDEEKSTSVYTGGSASDNRNTGRSGSDGTEPYGNRNGDGGRRNKSGKHIGRNGSGICDGNRSADVDRERRKMWQKARRVS